DAIPGADLAAALADARRGGGFLLHVGGLDGRGGLGAVLGGAARGTAARGARGLLHAGGAAVPAARQAVPGSAGARRYRHPHRALGAAFSLQRFHLAFMRQGTIPAGYFSEELLRALRATAP